MSDKVQVFAKQRADEVGCSQNVPRPMRTLARIAFAACDADLAAPEEIFDTTGDGNGEAAAFCLSQPDSPELRCRRRRNHGFWKYVLARPLRSIRTRGMLGAI